MDWNMKIQKKNLIYETDKTITVVTESSHYYPNLDNLNNPKKIAEMFETVYHISSQVEEHLYLLCLDNKYRSLGVFDVSHGGVDFAIANSRSIFQRALLVGASRIVLAHNHTSGEITPSKNDYEVTKKIKSAGVLMDVPLTDHLIIGRLSDLSMIDYFSFAEQTDELKTNVCE